MTASALVSPGAANTLLHKRGFTTKKHIRTHKSLKITALIAQHPRQFLQTPSLLCKLLKALALHIVERSETMLHAERQLRCAPPPII
jgi:hypothetical protein